MSEAQEHNMKIYVSVDNQEKLLKIKHIEKFDIAVLSDFIDDIIKEEVFDRIAIKVICDDEEITSTEASCIQKKMDDLRSIGFVLVDIPSQDERIMVWSRV